MTIANTIYLQLGGPRFSVMTGANQMMRLGNGLQFRLPCNFAKKKITYVAIILNTRDLYDMEFGKLYRHEYRVVDRCEDIYYDQLQEVFTRVTGLNTYL